MKKYLHIILTALAALPFVACQEQEEVYKPEVKDITVASVKNLVFLPAGGTGTITVDCATSFTATSDKNWCTVSVSGNEVTVTASANPSRTRSGSPPSKDSGVSSPLRRRKSRKPSS